VTLLSVLRPTTNQVGTNLVFDTFDAMTVGAAPTGWTVESGTSWTVQTAPAGLSGRALQGVGDVNFDNYIDRIFTRQTGGEVRVKWRVLTSSSTTNMRSGVMNVFDTTGGSVAQVGPLNGVWIFGNASGQSGSIGTYAASTVYTVEVTINLDTLKYKFAVDSTAYDNAGAWYDLTTGTTGVDRVKFSVFSPGGGTFYLDDVQVGTLVPTSPPPTATGTLSQSGTFDGVTLGVDRFAQITLGYANADAQIANLKVERSTNNATWADISAVAKVTATAAGRWTVTDRRPQYGSQATTYGGNVYYRVSGRNSGGSTPPSTSTVLTSDVAQTSFETNRFSYLSGLMAGAGGSVPSSNVGEAYPTYPLVAMVYAYAKTATAQYLTDASNQFAYIQTLTQANGIIAFPDYTGFFRDFHFRTVYHVAACSRLLRRVGATALADSMVAQCDSWVNAWFTNLNAGVVTVSRAVSGFDANDESLTNNQRVWVATTAYAVGDIVTPTARNGRTYRVTTAGTTAGTQPTWPTVAGGTVTNGTVTFTETTVTTNVGYGQFDTVSPYAPVAGSDAIDLNQVMETAAALALLLTDSSSGLFTAGTPRTTALNHLIDLTTSTGPFATSTGAVPIGEAYPAVNGNEGYDTLYGNYTMETTAVVWNYAAALGIFQYLDEWARKGLDWLNTSYGTEPLATMHYSGSTSTIYSEVVMRQYPTAVFSKANPLAKLRYTAAVNTTTDERIGDYDQNGVLANIYPTGQQFRVFQADVQNQLLAAGQTFTLTVTAASSQVAARAMLVGAVRAAASPQVTAVVKQPQARRTGASANAATVVRSTAATRTATAASAAHVVKRPAKTLTAVSTQTASVTSVKLRLATLTATSPNVPILARSVGATRTAASANIASTTRTVAAVRLAASAQTATVTAIKTKLATLTAMSAQATTVVKQLRLVRLASSAEQATITPHSAFVRTFTAVSSNTAGMVKAPAVTRGAVSAQQASVASIKAKLVTFAATSAQAATLTRNPRIVRLASSAQSATRSAVTGHVLAAASANIAAVVKRPARTLTGASSQAAQVSTLRVRNLLVIGASSNTATTARRVFAVRNAVAVNAASRALIVPPVMFTAVSMNTAQAIVVFVPFTTPDQQTPGYRRLTVAGARTGDDAGHRSPVLVGHRS
jgi:hypothetical protein